ncbi:group XIIB secretory phospholipase A2-like protein [Leptotrombidium deliense]|uniref:Group XIIB secretory phospholipase A2-like protein n=1 Tax=Leptotrombidium deliense TaxID=299467 RepID=A0A443RZ91_9ACAR|nr:group XIIB secretory phospholipase A2-like protein [Leptotrombidium deliense]
MPRAYLKLKHVLKGTRIAKNEKIEEGNGCGPGVTAKISALWTEAKMAECCNQHDICYTECNATKKLCDKKFKNCLKPLRGFFNGWYIDFMVKAVKGFIGCKAYIAAQEEFCKCEYPKKRSAKKPKKLCEKRKITKPNVMSIEKVIANITKEGKIQTILVAPCGNYSSQ